MAQSMPPAKKNAETIAALRILRANGNSSWNKDMVRPAKKQATPIDCNVRLIAASVMLTSIRELEIRDGVLRNVHTPKHPGDAAEALPVGAGYVTVGAVAALTGPG